MKMIKYTTSVNDKFNFELSAQEINELDSIEEGTNTFHILNNNAAHQVKVIQADYTNKTFQLEVNDTSYLVNLEDEQDLLLKKLGLSKVLQHKVNTVKAPMPGLVLDITTSIGKEVQRGDSLLILEAMKMENVLKSPGDGIVKSIHVKKGAAVEKGQLLIEME